MVINGYPIDILVGGIPTPLKNMSSSVGMIIYSQYFGKNKSHVPNHQSEIYTSLV